MKRQLFSRPSHVLVALIFLVSLSGCGIIPNNPSQPTAAPAPTSAATAVPSPASSAATATTAPVANPDVFFQDDFTNPSTGWPEDKFDNYFIGYHEPEYYHIEVTSPNSKTTVFEPQKQNFTDTTVELKVLTNSTKTSQTGDFRY